MSPPILVQGREVKFIECRTELGFLDFTSVEPMILGALLHMPQFILL